MHRSTVGFAIALTAFVGNAALAGPVLASPAEGMKIHSASLLLQLCNRKNAGLKKGEVRVLLGDAETILNAPGRDLSDGSSRFYHLINWHPETDELLRVRHLTQLVIEPTTDDGICIASLQLRLNGAVAMHISYPMGQTVDRNSSTAPDRLEISGETLRANASWIDYVEPPMLHQIAAQDLKARIEALVATNKSGEGVSWNGSSGTTISRRDDSTVHVVTRLLFPDTDVLDYWMIPGVDLWEILSELVDSDLKFHIEFDLVFSCQNGKLQVKLENLNKTSRWGVSTAGAVSQRLFPDWYAGRLQLGLGKSLKRHFARRILLGQPAGVCPQITVDAAGSVRY